MAQRPGGTARLGVSALASLIAAAAVLYVLSPYVALWRMSVALRSHDVVSLQSEIDWTQVRNGLKQELTSSAPSPATLKAIRPALSTGEADDELPEFGESFANNAMSNVVDEDCDAEHVEAMLGSGPVRAQGLVAEARHKLAWAFFTGPKSFQALVRVSDNPSQAPVRVRMVFTGGRGWRVTSVWLPRQMLSTPDANAT